MPDRKDNGEPTVGDLHAEMDRQIGPLHVLHAKRLQCRKGCCGCCIDGLTVFEVEAEGIRRHHPELLAEGVPHPEGACAFLDDVGACRIYEQRPYVCRTQGLPLRWIEERSGGNRVELRDICPLNEDGPPVESLPAEECWSIGPFEGRLARMQAAAADGELRRVSLRSLFRKR
jgi:uncharacterized protein